MAWPLHAALGLGRWQLPRPVWAWGQAWRRRRQSVKEVAAAGEDAFLAQLADARGSKVKEYVAVTGAGADNLSLPAYLTAIPQRSRRRALTQLRCGSHWLAEETGRWLRLRRSDRLCPHCLAEGAYHVEDVAHAILHCPRAAALRASLRSCSRAGRPARLRHSLRLQTDTSWQPFPVPSAPCMTDTILLSCSPALTLSLSVPWQRVWPSAP